MRRRVRLALLGALLPGVLLLETARAQEGQGAKMIPEALAVRLLGAFSGDSDVSILAGEMPSEVAFLVPLPEGATVVGSLRRPGGDVNVVIDAVQTPATVGQFYRTRLAAEGWTVVDPAGLGDNRALFRPAGDQEALSFCKDALELSLSASRRGDLTDLRLNVSPQLEYSLCNPDRRGGGGGDDKVPPLTLLPTLVDPEGAQSLGGGRSGGGDAFLGENRLRTPLGAGEVAEHYAEQLEAAGWEKESEEAQDGQALLIFGYGLEGETYRVVLVVREGEQEQLTVFLSAF